MIRLHQILLHSAVTDQRAVCERAFIHLSTLARRPQVHFHQHRSWWHPSGAWSTEDASRVYVQPQQWSPCCCLHSNTPQISIFIINEIIWPMIKKKLHQNQEKTAGCGPTCPPGHTSHSRGLLQQDRTDSLSVSHMMTQEPWTAEKHTR